MKNLTIELKDNDYVVRAKTDLVKNGKENAFGRFVEQMNEELIMGQTAFLEIEGSEMGPAKFEISRSE